MRIRGNLLLVELLVVILFFSLSSVITLEMFLTARDTSAKAETLNEVLFALEDWAERVSSSEDPVAEMRAGGFLGDETALALDKGVFTIEAVVSSEDTQGGTLYTILLSAYVTGETDPVLSLPADFYRPGVIE